MVGILLYSPKNDINWGSIVRIAHNFNVDFLITINQRYKRTSADTPNTTKHIPVFHYKNLNDFFESYPKECQLVSLEMKNSRPLESFSHPINALYCFGPESGNLPEDLLNKSIKLKIETNHCLNQAVCAGITLYDRHLKFLK